MLACWALLDNSARPSGAIVYTARDGNLTGEQIERLKSELEADFQGSANAGPAGGGQGRMAALDRRRARAPDA